MYMCIFEELITYCCIPVTFQWFLNFVNTSLNILARKKAETPMNEFHNSLTLLATICHILAL